MKNNWEFGSVYTGVGSRNKVTTGPLVQLRDSEESSELRRNSIKIFGRYFKFTLHKEDSIKEQ